LDSGVLFFEYRIVADPENEWTRVDVETVWNTTEVPYLFYKTITGLDNTVGVEYEYRAGIRFNTDTATDLTVVGETATIPRAFTVRTVGATVGATGGLLQMTVTGEIVAMGDYAGLPVSRFVEYRAKPPEVGPPENWTRVAIPGTQSAAGSFSRTITSGLAPMAGTTCEYQVGCAYGGADIGFGEIMESTISFGVRLRTQRFTTSDRYDEFFPDLSVPRWSATYQACWRSKTDGTNYILYLVYAGSGMVVSRSRSRRPISAGMYGVYTGDWVYVELTQGT
jgi:hypothetical protein